MGGTKVERHLEAGGVGSCVVFYSPGSSIDSVTDCCRVIGLRSAFHE